MKRFGYWRDPAFLISCALYTLNRWLLKPHSHSLFLHGQFNDCLLIPCALPLMLWLQRQLGMRRHDAPPTVGEIALHLLVWCVVCEVIGPRLMHSTGDVKDMVAYTAGALVAWVWWRWPARMLDDVAERS